jgi:hypothetical protein
MSMEFLVAVFSGLFSAITDQVLRRRRVQVLVHQAIFLSVNNTSPPASGSATLGEDGAPERSGLAGQPQPDHVFVKITNQSRADVEVTHIWFATTPEIHVLSSRRPLPARLRPDETYETWTAVSELPQRDGIESLARVRLSSGRTVKSRPNKNVPPFGYVAGGGSRQPS